MERDVVWTAARRATYERDRAEEKRRIEEE